MLRIKAQLGTRPETPRQSLLVGSRSEHQQRKGCGKLFKRVVNRINLVAFSPVVVAASRWKKVRKSKRFFYYLSL